MKPYETTVVEVSYEGTKNHLVKGSMLTLLGRNRLKKVSLDWRKNFPLYEEEAPLKLKEILTKFYSVFSEEICRLKDFKVKIPIEKTASPRFCRARPVSYAIKAGVKKELENQGIFKRMEYSRWVASIVPVVKNDN